MLNTIGNIVHETVVVSNNEDNIDMITRKKRKSRNRDRNRNSILSIINIRFWFLRVFYPVFFVWISAILGLHYVFFSNKSFLFMYINILLKISSFIT